MDDASEEPFMSDESANHVSSQGVFIGWLAIGLLALMAVFALVVLIAGAIG
jgi:hypothetical protein